MTIGSHVLTEGERSAHGRDAATGLYHPQPGGPVHYRYSRRSADLRLKCPRKGGGIQRQNPPTRRAATLLPAAPPCVPTAEMGAFARRRSPSAPAPRNNRRGSGPGRPYGIDT
jgi:hypothetical protein